MNIDDLRSELARRAEEAPRSHHPDRMAGIQAKRTTYRRSETLLAAGAGLLAVLGFLVVAPAVDDGADRGVDPTPATMPPERGSAFAWPADYAGDQLLGGKIGEPGQSRVVLRFIPTTTDLQWASLCTAPWPKVYARVSINGHSLGGTGCSADDRPGGPQIWFGDDAARNRRLWESFGVREGEASIVEVRLPGSRSLPADARLGVAFFDRSGPRVTSDGVTIHELWEAGEGTYRLVAHWTQPLTPTTRELSLAVPAGVDDPVVLSGLDGRWSETRASVTTTTVSGSDQRDGAEGGGIGGGVIEDIAGETVTISEEEGSVRDGTLVIAIYAPID